MGQGLLAPEMEQEMLLPCMTPATPNATTTDNGGMLATMSPLLLLLPELENKETL